MSRRLAGVFAFAGALLLAAGMVFADKLHLKDGRVLEGKVVRQGEGFLFFKHKIGSVESEQLFTSDQIAKIEKTDAPAGDKPAGDTAPVDKPVGESAVTDSAKAVEKKPGVTRIAVLNFGPPRSWSGEIDDGVGTVIQARHWEQAIPMLKKDKVDIVVARFNSGGGSAEFLRFHKVYHEKYKPNFRTVAWIESAISAAAMATWTIEEFYFVPGGNMGACTGWGGNLVAMKGVPLEIKLLEMEEAGKLGRRPSPFIMRAMQIQEPLSVDIDEHGEVIWRQDEAGQVLLNPASRVFTINAEDAAKYKFAKGIASNVDELAKAMGVQEWEYAGQDATKFIDKMMRESDAAAKRLQVVVARYQRELEFARAQQDRTKRGEFLGMAKKSLAELRRFHKENPMEVEGIGIDEEWLSQQERLLRELAQP